LRTLNGVRGRGKCRFDAPEKLSRNRRMCVHRGGSRLKNISWPRKNLPRRRPKRPAKRRSNARVALRSSRDAGHPSRRFFKALPPSLAAGFLFFSSDHDRVVEASTGARATSPAIFTRGSFAVVAASG
jgi:hypothetical protein